MIEAAGTPGVGVVHGTASRPPQPPCSPAAEFMPPESRHSTSAASVSKRTFYQHFPSKDELVRSYLRTLDEGGGTELERQLDRVELTPRERLLAIFEARPVDRFRGCLFHNATVESAGVVDGVDEIVRDHKLRFAQRLSDVAAEAGAADPRQLGNQLLVLFEGATALATSLNDTAPLVHARAAAATLIDRAGAQ